MNSRIYIIHSIARPLHQRGLSLIELMVAVTIGALMIFGATQVYVDGKNAYSANEGIARLQETARYALSVIEPDVRMANYWGLAHGALNNVGSVSQNLAVAPAANWASILVCGKNFAADLQINLQADNNQYVLSPSRTAACDTLSGWSTTPVVTGDTLTVRRTSTVSSPTQAGWLQICSTRLGSTLQSDGSACTLPPSGQVNNVIVDSYYVDQNSSQQAGMPSLRRKMLKSDVVGVPSAFADQEVTAGIEDMQIQFGIDPTGSSGVATRYVDPVVGAIPVGAQVVSVRIWLLVRSDTPEVGFKDDRVYEFGDRSKGNGVTGDLNAAADATKAYQPSTNSDTSPTGVMRYRRLLVSRTIQIRNTLGL